jgi:hypothetical protein
MSVIVGGDADGSSIDGPDARWIAVKIFNDRGVASSTAIPSGQWLLDRTAARPRDAPNVVDNSWSMSRAAAC